CARGVLVGTGNLYMRGVSTVCAAARPCAGLPPYDRVPSAIDCGVEARGLRRRRIALHHRARIVALYLALGPARPEAAGWILDGPSSCREARDHCGPLHLQMGNRCAYWAGERAGRAVLLDGLGARGAHPHDACLWRHAYSDGVADPGSRRHLRQGSHERSAAPRLPHLRAYAEVLAPVPLE